MAAKKKTDDKGSLSHDLTPTGAPVNSFTKATRVMRTASGTTVERSALPPAKRVRPLTVTARDRKDRALRRADYANVVGNTQNSVVDAPIGYRWMEPDRAMQLGQSLVTGSDEEKAKAQNEITLTSWLAGARRAFPNNAGLAGTPAIDEPHEVDASTEVSRRWEDLSAAEVDKAHQVMDFAGFPSNRAGRSVNAEADVTGIQLRNMMRVLGEHAAAGVHENVSQHFYGGTPATHIPDKHLREVRDNAHSEAQREFQRQVINPVMESTQFAESTAGMTPAQRSDRSRYIGAAAVSRTSPNTPFKAHGRFPNLIAAGEVERAAIEGRPIDRSSLAGSRPGNAERGLEDITSMLSDADIRSTLTSKPVTDAQGAVRLNSDGTPMMKSTASPKTGPFLTAMSKPDSADAYTVTDVMESQQMMPHLSSAKGVIYEPTNTSDYALGGSMAGEKKPPNLTVWSSRSGPPRGYSMKMTVQTDASGNPLLDAAGNVKSKPDPSENEPETVLKKGDGLIHALNDKAARNVNSAMGISRGANYADNVNTAQAARWGSEQAMRPQHFSSNADHYPVIRDWEAEGSDVGPKPGWLADSSNFDWMYRAKSNAPTFARNPNTDAPRENRSVLRRQPYLINDSKWHDSLWRS